MRIETVNAKGEKIVVRGDNKPDGMGWAVVECGLDFADFRQLDQKCLTARAIALSPFNPENR